MRFEKCGKGRVRLYIDWVMIDLGRLLVKLFLYRCCFDIVSKIDIFFSRFLWSSERRFESHGHTPWVGVGWDGK